MGAIQGAISQLFPPKPTLTEANLPEQKGKVFIVTGGNTGIGLEIIKILYLKGAKIYMAARSEAKATDAIKTINSTSSATSGEVKYLHLDLADLTTIEKSVADFAAQEGKLDVLWNNAGVSSMSPRLRTNQGYEMHMGINCLGHFLFTQLLLPNLKAAGKTARTDSVRVIWASSLVVDVIAPKGGVNMAELSAPSSDQDRNYAASKAGNWLLATEFARQLSSDGIVSVALNPGNLRTTIWDAAPMMKRLMLRPTLSPVVFGAYTNIWAGFSDQVTLEDGVAGRYIIPWGRYFVMARDDILDALKTKEEGVTEYAGRAGEFWTWCDEQTREYAQNSN